MDKEKQKHEILTHFSFARLKLIIEWMDDDTDPVSFTILATLVAYYFH